jgi:hypothetical protein
MTFVELVVFLVVLAIWWVMMVYCTHKIFKSYENTVNEINRQHMELERLSKLVDESKIKDDGGCGE